ncbi:GNAT family N-acetyltransferase [Sphingobium subterraneum]|uniref:Acetyltransferase n=1 Tax=Sphingobium subterraneum TaxID=627688 RepID=A0A841J7D0_9SPHN|nr:GNAT family N-acetyltransferase [Sphingobium subterraneum]MBB6124435.1 acetyltransferase [Sphingobium subterraneum]
MSGADFALPADPLPDCLPGEPDWKGYLTTRSGFEFFVRPATSGDQAALARFFDHVTPADLRFRFLSSVQRVGQDQLEAMTDYDHRTTENFLAYDKDRTTVFAAAMLVADPALERAEVAMAIVPDYKNRGASWTLLEHVSRFARAKGIKTLEAIESRDNHAAIELEREMGFTVTSCPGDATLMLVTARLEDATQPPRK